MAYTIDELQRFFKAGGFAGGRTPEDFREDKRKMPNFSLLSEVQKARDMVKLEPLSDAPKHAPVDIKLSGHDIVEEGRIRWKYFDGKLYSVVEYQDEWPPRVWQDIPNESLQRGYDPDA